MTSQSAPAPPRSNALSLTYRLLLLPVGTSLRLLFQLLLWPIASAVRVFVVWPAVRLGRLGGAVVSLPVAVVLRFEVSGRRDLLVRGWDWWLELEILGRLEGCG
jgi:hypothetical protein